MNLPGIEQSEEDIVRQAMNSPLSVKVKKAIGLLETFSAMGTMQICFSGGKDSIVLKRLAIMAGINMDAIYSVTTLDPPELIRYIKEHHADVEWKRQPKALLTRLVDRPAGPPTRRVRWCCQEYKENTGNDFRVKAVGVRAAESARRAGMWKQVNANKNRKNVPGSIILAPIVYWTDRDIWNFIRSEKLPYCSLYDEGFSRLGCVGCPLAGPNEQRREFARWPGFERVWKRAIYRFYEKWHSIPKRDGTKRFFEDFGSAEGLWRWWITGKGYSPELTPSLWLEFDDDCDDADCQSRFYTV